ncbi:MAG: bifunctional nuclease family protein [Armatimonadetes bacterium]|nr:bifunctional nuclease family protein [Armatimonadota bacterium]
MNEDRPGDQNQNRDEDMQRREGAPGGESTEPEMEGFQPTDLSRLFGAESSPPPTESEAAWLSERATERENVTPRKLYEKEVKVMAVYEQQTAFNGARAFFVQLRDNAGREIKVYVGLPEATSISMATEGINFRRPLTHDLTKMIIERMGWKIERITIDDLYNETFYAKLSLVKGNEVVDIDCRPSDAIALALRSKAPIYVAEEVLAAASRDETSSEEGDAPE